ncbi:unnamed protein product [Linum trigynum]|uniref:Uncharacterized protein n=1 Tax=Linum trigynum TaxID=586398 RepID=A0AAV2F1C1_9ROSI
MASLRCPVRVAHRNYKPEPDYRWTPQRDDYPELEFLIRPPHVCKSKILDSDFNKAIEKLCHHPYLKEWTSQMSIFKLLFIFCLPDLVEEMQSMLPLEPKYINPTTVIQPTYLAELCFIYITEGRIVEFTAALMAAHIFDTSAQDIHWYLHSPRYKEVRDLELIVKDVASLLKGVGFVLRSQDICVTDLRCFSSKSIINETELEASSSSFGPLSRKTKSVTISRKTIEGSTFIASPIDKLSARFYHSISSSRLERSKALSFPLENKVNFVVERLEGTKKLEIASRKCSRLLRMVKRVMRL